MIITDIKQIDCIAEETFGKTKGIVSVDMVRSLDDAIIEAGKENVSNVLLYIKGNGSDTGIRAVTIEQFNMFIEALNKHLETANII